MNDGRTTGDDRLFGHPVEIAGTTLYVSTGLVKFIPVNFGKSIPSMRFNRLCFYLFHAFSSFRGSTCVLPASRFWHLVLVTPALHKCQGSLPGKWEQQELHQQ